MSSSHPRAHALTALATLCLCVLARPVLAADDTANGGELPWKLTTGVYALHGGAEPGATAPERATRARTGRLRR